MQEIFNHDRDLLARLYHNPPSGVMGPDGWRAYCLHLLARLTKLKRAIAENRMSLRDLEALQVGLAVQRARRNKGVRRPRPRHGGNPIKARMITFSKFPDVLNAREARTRRK